MLAVFMLSPDGNWGRVIRRIWLYGYASGHGPTRVGLGRRRPGLSAHGGGARRWGRRGGAGAAGRGTRGRLGLGLGHPAPRADPHQTADDSRLHRPQSRPQPLGAPETPASDLWTAPASATRDLHNPLPRATTLSHSVK